MSQLKKWGLGPVGIPGGAGRQGDHSESKMFGVCRRMGTATVLIRVCASV